MPSMTHYWGYFATDGPSLGSWRVRGPRCGRAGQRGPLRGRVVERRGPGAGPASLWCKA